MNDNHPTFRADFGDQCFEHVPDTNIIGILIAIKLADSMVIGIQRLRNLIRVARGRRALVNYDLAVF